MIRLKNHTDKDDVTAQEIVERKESTEFRFLSEREKVIRLDSPFQNSLNICLHHSFIHGQYQLTFYTQYWMLNNTSMPLELIFKSQ